MTRFAKLKLHDKRKPYIVHVTACSEIPLPRERLFKLLVSGSGVSEARRQAAQRLRKVLLEGV